MKTKNNIKQIILPLITITLLCLFKTDMSCAQEIPSPKKIIIDTDPGSDDAFALLWLQSLIKQSTAELIAVTTVAGNVSAQHTFTNASKILALGDINDIEIGRSVVSTDLAQEDASHIHGRDGIGGLSSILPASQQEFDKARYADDILIEKLNALPNEITLIAVGPLTNLAAAETKAPGILKKAKEVIIMGGAFHERGNATSHAEFNIYYHPKAAQTVFNRCDNIVVLPLDITHQVSFTREHALYIQQTAPEHPVTQFIVSLFESMSKMLVGSDFNVHDATTLAYLFYPETLRFRRAEVRVETQGQWSEGQTLFDDRSRPKMKTNAWVALEVNNKKLLAVLVKDLKLLVK